MKKIILKIKVEVTKCEPEGLEATHKECACCHVWRLKCEFSNHIGPGFKDGLYSYCKSCVKVKDKERYIEGTSDPDWLERRLKASRKYKENNRDSIAEYDKKYRHKASPQKRMARDTLNRAIARGAVVKKSCEKCGEIKVQAHHHDYTLPYDVKWLCISCHGLEHRKYSYDAL